jgi:ribonuclease HI
MLLLTRSNLEAGKAKCDERVNSEQAERLIIERLAYLAPTILAPSALPNHRFTQDQLDDFAKRVKTFGSSGTRSTEQTSAAAKKFQGIVGALPATSLQVWTDGSKLSRDAVGPTGAGAVIYLSSAPKNAMFNLVYHLGLSTNNTGEFWAIGGALTTILENNLDRHKEIHIFSDSQFVINCLTGVYQSSTHFKITADIQKLIKQCRNKPIFYHVPGHAGIPGNEAADVLAKAGAHYSESHRENLPLMGIMHNLGFNHLLIDQRDTVNDWKNCIEDFFENSDSNSNTITNTCSGMSLSNTGLNHHWGVNNDPVDHCENSIAVVDAGSNTNNSNSTCSGTSRSSSY